MRAIGYKSLLLEDGVRWHDGSGQITTSFMTEIPSYYRKIDTDGDGIKDSYRILGRDQLEFGANVTMRADEQDLSNRAIAAWNEIANVNLVSAATGEVGDITFASADFGPQGGFGFITKFPDGTADEPDRQGDVWINNGLRAQDVTEFGHTSWNTYLHELGHALGLFHPNDDPNNDANSPDNSNQYTVMSYIEHPSESGESLGQSAWPLTPMLYDIAALQELYGANLDTRSGDTRYFGEGAADELAYQYGADNMKVGGRDVLLTIWDAGGRDVIDTSDLRKGVEVDLRPGKFSTIGAEDDNVAMAYAVKVGGEIVNFIEDVIGTVRGDRVVGNGADNLLKGGRGADSLRGNSGEDELRGGAGRDVMFGGRGDDELSGGRGADVFAFNGTLDEGRDTIKDFTDGLDEIRVKGLSFGDLDIVQDGSDVRITLDGMTEILLENTQSDDITRADFDFV